MPDRLERSQSVHATPTASTASFVLDGSWLFGPALLAFGVARNRWASLGRASPHS